MNGMNKNGYERYDACYGKVNSVCRAGAFVILDDGELFVTTQRDYHLERKSYALC